MSRRGSKRGREARYAAAVQRQIEANARWDQAEPKERIYMAKPAPISEVLRGGATSNEVARTTESDVPPVVGWGLWPTFRHTDPIKETSEMTCQAACKTPTPAQAHCSVCHRTFGGVTGFDAHRKDGACVDPASLGFVERDGVWRTPMSDAARARFAEAGTR